MIADKILEIEPVEVAIPSLPLPRDRELFSPPLPERKSNGDTMGVATARVSDAASSQDVYQVMGSLPNNTIAPVIGAIIHETISSLANVFGVAAQDVSDTISHVMDAMSDMFISADDASALIDRLATYQTNAPISLSPKQFNRKRGAAGSLGFITFANDHVLPAKLYQAGIREAFRLSLLPQVRRDARRRVKPRLSCRSKRR